MRVYPEQLAAHLEKQLLPVYLVSGEELLLMQECCDLVRQRARAGGCSVREVIDAGARDFDWRELLSSANALSLFAERRLLELRLPSGKPGAEGSKALQEYLASGGDDILLIVSGKIDKPSTSSRWYRALDAVGVTVQVWPVKEAELPRWLGQRVAAAGMRIDRDALELLCERIEGNLLAAAQEVEKLKLLAENGHITARTIAAAVSDNARFDVFQLTDRALAGDLPASLRALHGLRGEGTEPPVALWSLARDIRTLYSARLACDGGDNAPQALSALGAWKSRIPLLQRALARLDAGRLARLLEQAARVDGSIKGFGDGRPWDELEDLVIDLCQD